MNEENIIEEKEFGIDLIKKAIKFVYDTTMEGIGAFKDKKLSFSEILGFTDNVYSGVMLGTKFDTLFEQCKDINSDEAAELVEYTSGLVKDATSDEVDIIIEHAIGAIQSEIVVYNDHIKPIIEIIKNKKK